MNTCGRIIRAIVLVPALVAAIILTLSASFAQQKDQPATGRLNVVPKHFTKDPSVKIDYDIVYVRAPRKGDKEQSMWAEGFNPTQMDPGADLMLLHPNGSEELLVAGGPNGSVTDPFVSFDGEWVYYSKFHDVTKYVERTLSVGGSDIYKIHVKSKKVVQLTKGEFTPNTGAAPWSKDLRSKEPGKVSLAYGAHNLGPCPLPGGKVMFTSNRNAFRPNQGFTNPCLQLFVMDDDGSNVEMIGHINIGSALHPTILRDGRVMFSSYEAQGLRDIRIWGIWTIHPDGTNWDPLFSAFFRPNIMHFQTQLSDGRIVVETYYNLNNEGFGPYYVLPEQPSPTASAFGPGYEKDPRNPPLRQSPVPPQGKASYVRVAFSPQGIQALTPFANTNDSPAPLSDPNDKNSPRVGKFTHPSGVPDNHMMTVWSVGPANHHYGSKPESFPRVDAGIYLIKDGKPIDEPGQMLLIKNDPKYNEQWPRALVPYKRIYGVDEPKLLVHANDGKRSKHLPEGTPFGMTGTSSLYKRESYPGGAVPKGSVTATYVDGTDPSGFRGLGGYRHGPWAPSNWSWQGSDAGRYDNSDIWGIRIVTMEASTDLGKLKFANHANERIRILGEFPVRHFNGSVQPVDPDGNPDTSFLAKIPANMAWTFHTLDNRGMVLNIAQTWHQVMPGEIRNNCGGCHAHSQQPTLFEKTVAAKPDYAVWDLTDKNPLFTTKANDQSGKKWDAKDQTGVRFAQGVKNVEFHRDIKPLLDRSCNACHSNKANKPAGNLVLDDELTYERLARPGKDRKGEEKFGPKEYTMHFQSRRSLLIWKIFGERLDGWTNDDFPTETVPGDPKTLQLKGKPFPATKNSTGFADWDYHGPLMPPPEAVAGTYVGPDGKKVKVAPLSDEDKLTFVRWIDLGCPIDLDYDPSNPAKRGYGWACDDQRPTLTLTYPAANANDSLSRILIGMHDHYTGLDMKNFQVVADFPLDGVPAGQNLASKFKSVNQGVWELQLNKPITDLPKAKLTVLVKDIQGNITRIDRTFSVGPSAKR